MPAKLPKWSPPVHISCLSCKGVGNTEWCSLGTDQLQLIDRDRVAQHYKAGDTIYRQGETCRGIFCIEQGTVAVRMTQADGNTKILRIADPGCTIGYADFFGGGSYRSSAVVLEDAVVCHIPAEPLRNVLSHSPALGLAFLAHGSEDLVHSDLMNMQQALHSVRTRIAHLFLSLKDRHGASRDGGAIEISLPMSWQEAAELIGARPETVSRTLQAMVEDGVIQMSGRHVTVGDLDVLLDEIEATEA